MSSRRLAPLTLVTSLVLAATSAWGLPAATATPPGPSGSSWLYVMQSPRGALATEGGSTGTLVFDARKVLKFTDRPQRESAYVTAREALSELGFPSQGVDSPPNASVVIDGGAAMPLEITGATVTKGKVRLKVRALGQPLRPGSGRISLFIDDATINPITFPTYEIDGTASVVTVVPSDYLVHVTFLSGPISVYNVTLTQASPYQTLPKNLTVGDVTITSGSVSLAIDYADEGGTITLSMTYVDSSGTSQSTTATLGTWTGQDFYS